ncbi:MAG: hypothetical protein K8I30_08775 [Anaerolineae bacterium]|nr:hypothetical protein [Anaerolineae bacterium]
MPLHDFFHTRRILTSLILILVVLFLALMIAHPVSGQLGLLDNPPGWSTAAVLLQAA